MFFLLSCLILRLDAAESATDYKKKTPPDTSAMPASSRNASQQMRLQERTDTRMITNGNEQASKGGLCQ